MKINEVVLNEAFGAKDTPWSWATQGDTSAFQANEKIPADKLQNIGQLLFIGASLYGMIKGASIGISFIDSNAGGAILGKLLSGGFFGALGLLIAGPLGMIPGAALSAPARQKRKAYIKKEVENLIEKNPEIKNELSQFINGLVTQTPDVLVNRRDMIDVYKLISASQKQNLTPNDEGFEVFDDLIDDVITYFKFQESKWDNIAEKYGISGEELREVYNYLYPNVPIEKFWLSTLKDNVRLNSLKPKGY